MAEQIVEIHGEQFQLELAERAADVVRNSGVLIHPTATIHGYGCRYDKPEAVERIRAIKGREDGKPMIVLVPSFDWLDRVCEDVPAEAKQLTSEFWPGGLSLVLLASAEFKEKCAWPADTVAVRHCAHPFIITLMAKLEMPMVSTSLGLSGQPVPEDSMQFTAGLYQKGAETDMEIPELSVIDPELDNSTAVASTLVDLSGSGEARLLRSGAVSKSRLEKNLGYRLS